MTEEKQDWVWETVREEAAAATEREPMLASFFHAIILNHRNFEDALSFHLASKLESVTLPAITLRDLIDEAFRRDPLAGQCAREDMVAFRDRDPACEQLFRPLLYLKGYHAIQAYRVAHYYWTQGRFQLALFMQSRISEVFAVDIHPAARIGKGFFMDHATSVVIGETAVVEDNVSILHEVTLGGTGKVSGDRHPKVRQGVLIAAGAKVLGNVEIGEGAKVGAGAVVLADVPPHSTVVGVPGRTVGRARESSPALEMDQCFFTDENGEPGA